MELREEMAATTAAVESIQQDIASLANRSYTINRGEKCARCGSAVITPTTSALMDEARGWRHTPFSYSAAPPPVVSVYTDHQFRIWRKRGANRCVPTLEAAKGGGRLPPLYVFPCGTAFLTECLILEVAPTLGKAQAQTLKARVRV